MGSKGTLHSLGGVGAAKAVAALTDSTAQSSPRY